MLHHIKHLKSKYDFDITRHSVETRIGVLELKRMNEYNRFCRETAIILMDRSDYLSLLSKLDSRIHRLAKELHTYDFLKMVNENNITAMGVDIVVELFRSAFKYLFGKDVLFEIKDSSEYDELILLIKWVHGLPVEMENPNPVIARLDKIKKQLNSRGESMDFDTMYSSVWIAIGCRPDNLTMYEFTELLFRITSIKAYETSTLFKTVDVKNDITVTSWSENRIRDTKKYVNIDKLKNKTF